MLVPYSICEVALSSVVHVIIAVDVVVVPVMISVIIGGMVSFTTFIAVLALELIPPCVTITLAVYAPIDEYEHRYVLSVVVALQVSEALHLY